MHHSYKQITWLTQVQFFVRSCMGWNVKRKPHQKKTKPPTKQATLDKTKIFEECFLLKEQLVVW